MSEQKETNTLPQCYLVTLEVDYEQPDIIKGFGGQAEAEAFRSNLEDYQRARPAWPDDGAPPDEWTRVEEAREAWLYAHPAGPGASGADRFGIIAAPFVPPISEQAEMQSMETAPRDGTRILIKNKASLFECKLREYQVVGSQWLECWFVDGKFQRWCGDEKTRSTGAVDPMGWAPLPDTQAPAPISRRALESAKLTLASTRYLLTKHCPNHHWMPSIERDIKSINEALAAMPGPEMVDLPAFDGYQAHIVRELQAVFVQECEKAGIKVRKL
ncbi:hypothetical protein WG29040_23285 [Pseudomonas sp. PAMC 29040]|uniref:hypothetical protein n=1 Tax=Pseudomonas sp. PAMC 29040 TaxID=2498450 RepID=UPI000FB360E5|nr:hypothetical protein [Pseudomonas sp. PAMC 29040]RUT30865.1 hypothetical protein WG29040_23285 [Pseudomonas sp. PAMC 29040]